MPPKKPTAKLPPKNKSSTDNNNNNNNSNSKSSLTTDEPEKQQQLHPPPTGRPPYDPYKQSFVKQDYCDHDQNKNKQEYRNNNNNEQDDTCQKEENQQKISEIEDLLHIPDPQPFLVSCVVNHIHNLRVMVDPRDATQKKRDERRKRRKEGVEKQQQKKQKQKQKRQRNTTTSDAATIATTSMMTTSTSSGSVPSFIKSTATKRISHRSVSDDDDDDDDTSSNSTENDVDDDETTSSTTENTDSSSSSNSSTCSIDDDERKQKLLVSSSSAIATATSSGSGSNTNYSYNKLFNNNNNNNNNNNHDDDDDDEIGYNNNPHLWDYYSLWDCPPTVVSSLRKRNLYYFQQEQIQKDKERKKLKIENDLLKLELLPMSSDGKKSSSQKEKEKSKKEKKEKKSGKKEKKNKDKKSKRTTNYDDEDEGKEQMTTKNNDDETEGLPACYLSKYDKRENPILVATSNDKEASALAYQATTIDDDFYYLHHQHQQKLQTGDFFQDQPAAEAPQQRKHSTAADDNNDSSYFFSSPIVDAPPSRVVFDPLRYHKIIAKTEFETPHPAFPQMSPMFNGKMEISCVLTAPTMYHDMPSKAEAKAIREKEQQYFAGIPSTERMIRENMATSSIQNFPSAAALRSYGRGAVRELEKILQEKKKNHHSNQHDDVDHDDHELVDADLAAYLKLKERRRRREVSKATGKRHFAGLLKLQFSTSQNQQHQKQHHQDSSKKNPSSSSTSFTLVHCLGPVQFLPPIESALFVPQTPTSICLCIAEVPDPELHPMEQILLKYVIEILETDEYCGSLSSAHVNNLVRETPQFQFVIGGGAGGSTSSSSSASPPTNNTAGVRSTTTTTNGPFYETWIDFITAHSNIEFATFTYTENDLKEMMQPIKDEARASSSGGIIIPNELRLVAWKNVQHFMEGDYSRWANKLENERQVVEVMKSCLGVRPYEQKELVKLLGSNRAFVSLSAPCLKKMLSIVSEDSRYVILNSRYHPLTIEMRRERILTTSANNDDDYSTNYSSSSLQDDVKQKQKQTKQQEQKSSSSSSFHPREIKLFDQDRLRMAGFSSLVPHQNQNQQQRQTTRK